MCLEDKSLRWSRWNHDLELSLISVSGAMKKCYHTYNQILIISSILDENNLFIYSVRVLATNGDLVQHY